MSRYRRKKPDSSLKCPAKRSSLTRLADIITRFKKTGGPSIFRAGATGRTSCGTY